MTLFLCTLLCHYARPAWLSTIMLWQHSRQLFSLHRCTWVILHCAFGTNSKITKLHDISWYSTLTWRYLLLVVMVKFLQLLPHMFSHPQLFIPSPQWPQGPGNWGTLRDRNAVIFGLAGTEKTSQLPCVPPHTLTCGHSGMHTHSREHKASVAAETWRSSIGNPLRQFAVLTTRTLSSLRQIKWSVQANTNCLGKQTYLSSLSRHLTKMGRIPDFIKSSIGGFLSLESSFLKKKTEYKSYKPYTGKNSRLLLVCGLSVSHLAACTALSWITALSLVAFCDDKERRSIINVCKT